MAAKARKAVLETGDWLTASQFARMAGFNDARSHTNKWRKDGQIFTIRYRGVDYFPRYALDPSISDQPAKGLASVLSVFHGRKDDWGTAYWFASINSFLGGKRPQDLLIDQPDRVVAAAEDEVAGVVHG
ncbi:hypothetical protein AS156_18100 [Bradyrhizobium macuxiense]|uniref:Antitoxin Xre/MbcA/ParS-like toxin-binding domain-containing protein n=1 Tax=Bradyrhizobium macuxiense TaxID=1755647 RepID=A0A109JGS4_9BRAD|nr:hypothetical protein [Bradyrhizobium macuxiense]KWV48568.1 hypothetical protein AS156_18100 [Bradyrhizobium macuxiense]